MWVPGLRLQKVDPRTNRVVAEMKRGAVVAASSDDTLWTIDEAFSVTRRQG